MQHDLEFTDQVVVFKVVQFKEADCRVKFLSSSRGMLTAFAFGGAKSRKRFAGCLDFLNHVLFKVHSNRRGSYLCLLEGSLLHRFSTLQQNLPRLGMAVNCLKFLEAAHVGTGNASDVFKLFVKTLLLLDQAPWVPDSLPLFFRARLAAMYGYQAQVRYCQTCGRDLFASSQAFFALAQGGVFCPVCLRDPSLGQSLSGADLEFLNSVFTADPAIWADQPSYSPARKNILHLIDRFVQIHLGLVWDNGNFRPI